MNNVKKPHKHSALIKQWADGAEIQMRNKEFGSAYAGPEWLDVLYSPGWGVDTEYRVKPQPNYPKSTLAYDDANSIYCSACYMMNDGNALMRVADAAVKEFIKSGEMVKYFTNPNNGYITKGNS